ncbi:MAG: hypothetical protein K2N06_05295 [Oscillospiraceae bacterium]|nr:hypothetical protein [Oscillospiraceae bacterium]
MKFKILVSAFLSAIMLCFTPIVQAVAAEPYSIVSPLYEIATDAYGRLSITSSNASCTSSIQRSSAVKITAEQYLQKQRFLWIWTTYDDAEWTKTAYTNVIAMSNTKTGLSSGKYRLKTIFTLTDSNGKTETITVYSDTKSV